MNPLDLINVPSLSQVFEDSRHLDSLARSLAAFLKNQRWFAAKNEGLQSVDIFDSVEIPSDQVTFELLLATVVTRSGSTDCYAVPIACVAEASTDDEANISEETAIATLAGDETSSPHYFDLLNAVVTPSSGEP